MVQILPRQPSTFEKIIGPMSEGIGNVAQGMAQRQQQQKQKVENDQRSKALVALGIPEMVAKEAVRNPDIMKSLLENQMLEERASRIMGTSTGGRKEDSFDGSTGQGKPSGEMSSGGGLTGKPASGLQAQSDEQLGALTGIKGYSEPAKAELRRRQEERKLSQSHFEPESEKLEAKRVNELAQEIETEYNAAKNEDMRLERMGVLDAKGNVSTPLMIKALDIVGMPIGVLGNPDTEEFRKLEADFVRDVSKVFPGGKVTNYELMSYLKTIPGLMNTPDGRKAIMRNRRLLNEAKKVKYDEYKKIIKENNGKKPPNLGLLVEERTAPKISKIEDQFIQGIEKEASKFQQPIRMYDPEGNAVDIPPNEIERAMKAGAKFSK